MEYCLYVLFCLLILFRLPKSLSEAMKISSCSSNNENDEVFFSRVLTVLEGVLEYALNLKETERPLTVSSSEIVAKQKVFLKVCDTNISLLLMILLCD